MQDKNKIKVDKFLSPPSNPLLKLNKKEFQYYILKQFLAYNNKNIETLSSLLIEKKKFANEFLTGKDMDKIKTTPIFYLCEILKAMNQTEIQKLMEYLGNRNKIDNTIDKFLGHKDYYTKKKKK